MKLFKNVSPEFIDERGGITKVLDDGTSSIRSVLLITSKAGAIRANHYHKTDSHFCYMVSGKMEYLEQPLGAPDSQRQSVIVEAGDVVYTPPMVVHAMRFLEDSVFFAFAAKSRHQDAYEHDTVRVKMI